jgi:ketosteroid isomerase-like protein
MLEDHVKAMRAAVDAFNRRDLDAFLEWAHPDVEWHPVTAQAEGGGVFRGHEGIREWWGNTEAAFEQIEMEISDIRDLGEELAFFGRIRGRFRSGVPFDSEVGYHSRFRGDRVIYARSWWSHSEALEAAGLSE